MRLSSCLVPSYATAIKWYIGDYSLWHLYETKKISIFQVTCFKVIQNILITCCQTEMVKCTPAKGLNKQLFSLLLWLEEK